MKTERELRSYLADIRACLSKSRENACDCMVCTIRQETAELHSRIMTDILLWALGEGSPEMESRVEETAKEART